MKWELVVEHTSGAFENSTYRLQIPEGWLYRYGSQLVFVPNAVAAASVFAPPALAGGVLGPIASNNHVANAYGSINAKDQ